MSDRIKDVFFDYDGTWYVGREGALGPWLSDACHAGPPSAALARDLEQHCLSNKGDKTLLRITINLLRPIPMEGFRISVITEKEGKTTAYLRAEMFSRQGNLCAVATSLHQRLVDIGPVPTIPDVTPDKKALDDFFQHGEKSAYSLEGRRLFPSDAGFAKAVDVVSAEPGNQDPLEVKTPGSRTIWLRTPQLIAEEKMSGFQSLCPLADCGNGFAANAGLDEFRYMNTDLTISMHRAPESEWLASTAQSHWGEQSHGASYATLFDERGSVGSAIQTLYIQKA